VKMIVAIVKHFRLDKVREALTEAGVEGMTITEVKGFGKQKGHVELYRGASYEVNFLPKIKIEVAVRDDRMEEVVEVIRSGAHTGEVGDGKIFVYDLDKVMRIRTGDLDDKAL